MAFELIAAAVFGLGVGGLAMLLRRMAPAVTPRFAIPASAGLAMLGFAIWSEYAWFERQAEALPHGVEVARTYAEPSTFRPWTYVAPYVGKFIAVDMAGARRHQAKPEQVLANVYFFVRHAPTAQVQMLFDCGGARRADITQGAQFSADGTVDGVDWRSIEPDDPLLAVVCAGG